MAADAWRPTPASRSPRRSSAPRRGRRGRGRRRSPTPRTERRYALQPPPFFFGLAMPPPAAGAGGGGGGAPLVIAFTRGSALHAAMPPASRREFGGSRGPSPTPASHW